jgi:YD repeat-containing protein
MLTRHPARSFRVLLLFVSPLLVWAQTPQVTQVSPASGSARTMVTITGSAFGSSQGSGSVSIGGASAAVATWSGTQIMATVPSAAQTGAGSVSVTNGVGQQSNAFGFAVLPQSVFSGPATYSYDESGRLVGAVAATGDSVKYSYDAVGNILSITRYSASQFAFFTFSPKLGPVGTNVTISGSNFSANPAQDTVTFNGASATILSATSTSLVVSVPSGATTGPLTISSPAGSITTADPFTVTNSDGKPRIDSFSPQIVAPGTAVTINGANFDTTPANDRLIVNVTSGLNPTSATATTMAMNTPSATGSGRISLSTPNGSVTSTADLFIPPSGYTVGSVSSTGRTTAGTPATVTLSSTNQIGLLLIDGKKGQMVSAVSSSSTFSGSCSFYLYNPSNTAVLDSRVTTGAPGAGSCSTSGGLFDSQVLPASGTYAFLVSPGAGSGHATLTPYLFDDIQGTVTLNSSITATTSFPGQNIRYLLFGSANQHISISIISSTFTSCTVSVFQPDGVAIVNNGSCSDTASFVDVPVLSQNGFYTILLDPAGSASGSVTFKVNDATDISATVPLDGTQVTVNTTVPGQNARLTFSGTIGQQISATFQNVSFSGGMTATLLDPSGAQVNSAGNLGISTIFMDDARYCSLSSVLYLCGSITLPATGTYTVFLNPAGAGTGQAKVSVFNVPTDTTISSSLGGAQISVPLNVPGQNNRLTFSGTQNGRVGITFSGASFTGSVSPVGFKMQVLLPDGTPLGGAGGSALSFSAPTSGFVDYNDIYAFPSTGTYTVTLDPLNDSKGTVNVNLYDATDVSLTISADGSTHSVSTTAPSQNAHLNFAPSVGQRISALLNSSTYASLPGFTLRRVDGTGAVFNTAFSSSDGASRFLDAFTITQTGSYFLFVDPNGTDTGSSIISLYTITDLSGTLDTSGTPFTATITTPGQNGTFTFTANSGQTLTLTGSGSSFSSGRCLISILNPSGSNVGNRDCASTGSTSWTLTQTGTFKAFVDPTLSSTGNVTFSVQVQ